MTQDEIIEMAREAGGTFGSHIAWVERDLLPVYIRFAKLVAAKEREACAKVCETHGVRIGLNIWNGGPDWYKHGKDCAKVIRARGEQA